MNIFFMILLVGISLSMDAFSLALIYGMYGIDRLHRIVLSVIVGLFHFFMPLVGLLSGKVIYSYFSFDVDLIVGIIFFIIGVEMIISSYRDEEVKVLISFFGFLLFGFSVSIDSLTTGIGIGALSDNYLIVAGVFMVVSAIFTYLGLVLGRFLNDSFGKKATVVGGVMLVVLALYYIF